MKLTPKEKETNYEIIKFLIENGSNRDMICNSKKKAFDLAEKHSNKE